MESDHFLEKIGERTVPAHENPGACALKAKGLYPAILAILLILLCSCTGYHPVPLDRGDFSNGIKTKRDGNVTVSVSILTEKESSDLFGVDLADKNIQAVWIRVKNDSDKVFFVLKSAVDPDYFSAYEVAYMQRSIFHPFLNDRIVERFKELSFTNPVPARSTVQGFLFINRDECQRQLDLELATYGQNKHFIFFFELDVGAPTLFDIEKLHSSDEVENIADEEHLKEKLEHLPAITTDKQAEGTGDPVNLMLIGTAEDLFPALVTRHWHMTEKTETDSVLKMVESFMFGTTYLHSPISPLFLFNRPQDIALQKARETINQRNHLRLWITGLRYRGKPVWAGTISRDVGVRFTFLSPFLVTHKIDPDVDEVRNSFGIDMLFSNHLEALAFVKGAPHGTKQHPRHNLSGDIYFSDGLRLVLFFTRETVPFHFTKFLEWEPPVGRHM